MIHNNIFKKGSVLFLSCLLIFSGFSTAPLTIVQAEEAETVKEDIEIEDMVPLFANRVKNPEIKYSKHNGELATIDNWKLTASNNVMVEGETDENQLNITTSGGLWRGLSYVDDRYYNHYELFKHNDGDDEIFRGKAKVAVENDQTYEGKHVFDEGWAFYSLSQTVELDEGEDYVFRMDYDTDSEANFLVRVYPGEKSSGDGYLETEEGYEEVTTVKKGDGLQHLEMDLSAAKNEDGKATVAIRHIPKKGENGEFHIYRVGFFLKEDYDLQGKVEELFTNSDQNALPYKGETYTEAINNMQYIIDKIENKLNDGTGYHTDVKKYVGDALQDAKNMLKSIEDAKQAINKTFEDRPVSDDKIRDLKRQIEKITSEEFKKDLQDLFDLKELKEKAFKEIDEKQVDEKELTEKEQQEEKEQLEQAIEKAVGKIESATSEEEILDAVKELSKVELTGIASLTNKKIDKVKHVGISAQDTAKRGVKNYLEEGLEEIDAVEGIDVADSIRLAFLRVKQSEFDMVELEYKGLIAYSNAIKVEKEQLKKDLQEEAKQARDFINGLEGLSEEEKEGKEDDIEQALNTAMDNIDKTTAFYIENAKRAGSLAIEKIKGTAEIDAEEKLALDKLSGLDLGDKAEEKENAIKNAANKARTDIDNVRVIEDVAKEVTIGKENINKALKDAQFEYVRNNAKEDIASKAQVAIDYINGKENLNDDEKSVLIDEVNTAKDEAFSEIDRVNTESGVNKAVTNAENTFELAKTKANAMDGIKAEANKAKEAVEGFQGLSDDEQTATKEAIDQELAETIESIQKSDSKTKVTSAAEAGSLSIYKKQEKAEIDGYKNTALNAFNKLENLGDDKDGLKDAIEQAAEDSKAAMDKRDSKNGITSELRTGKANIDKALEAAQLQDTKNKATADIHQVVTDAEAKVDALTEITDKENETAKAAFDQAKQEAIDVIDKATTEKEMDNAIATAKKAIDFAVTRVEAKEELRKEASSINDSIDKIAGVNQDEKVEAKNEVETILNEKLGKVTNAEDASEIEEAVKDGKASMQKIVDNLRAKGNSQIDHTKENAKNALNDEAERAKKAVDSLGLSDEEKQTAKEAIEEAKNEAIANVEDADEIITIEQEKDKGLVTIEQEKAQAEIDSLQEATDEEKDTAKSNVDTNADNAKNAIGQAGSLEGTETARKDGIANIKLDVEKAKATDAINKAEKDALAELENLNNLTSKQNEEKKQAIKDAASSAKEQVDKATDKSEVTTALNDGKVEINNVLDEASLQDAKNKAKADVETKQTRATNKVENLPDLAKEEKQAALNAIDQAVTDANKAIDEASNKTAINDAKDDAYATIDKAFNKANAQDDMRHHAFITNQSIDYLKGVNAEEKDGAKEDVNKVLTDALTALEDTETDMDDIVKQAKADMDEVYNKIVNESDDNIDNAKDKAKGDLSTEAQDAIEEINKLPKLGEKEKEEAISNIKTKQEEGEKRIDDASSPGEATTIKDETVISIEKIVTDATLEDSKIQATEDLQEKAEITKSNIDELTEIDKTEKNEAKAAIDNALADALANVNDATSTANVDTAVSNGKNAMQDIYDKLLEENNNTVEESKDKQKADLQNEVKKYKEEIDALKHVSEEEKDAAKAEIEKIAKEAETAIDEANSSKAMTEIKTDAVEDMKDEVTKVTLTDAKIDANKQLQDHAAIVKDDIDALTGVSEEEKESAKTAIDNAVNKAVENVNNSSTVEEVKDATSAGKSAMDEVYNKVQTESNENNGKAQQAAKDELDRVAENAKQEIDDLSDLSADEKQAAKDAIDQAVEDGKATIDKADNPKDITSAKEETLDKIKAEKDAAKLADAKAKANESLQNKANSLNESIDALTGISNDENAKAKEDIADALANAKDKVKNASDISTVEDAETAGKDAMQDIFDAIVKEDEENINLAKDEAKQELDDAAIDAKEAIDKLSNITDEQKTAAKVDINEALETGKAAIDEAGSPESITQAKKDALDKMKAAQGKAELNDAQAKSKAEIRTYAKNTQDAVDALIGVSDDAKETAKKSIANEITKAESVIDEATSIDAVEQAEKAGKSAIDGIYNNIEENNEENIQNAKDAATKQLGEEATNAKKDIEALENLSDDEKDSLKKEIDDAVSSGKDAVKDAENLEDITKAKDEAIDAIDKTVDQAQLKNAQNKAEQELQEKAASTIEAINSLSGVDKDAKKEATAAVNKALENGLNDVQAAKNMDAVEKAVADGKAEMDRIYDDLGAENNTIIDEAKDKATEELEKEAEDAKDKVDKLPNLSDDEKEAAKNKIDEEVEKGKEKIEKAESPDEITESKKDTVESIGKIVDDAKLADKKISAKDELEQKAQSTTNAIDELANVSKEDKQAAKELIDQALADAKESIDQAKDEEAVQEAVNEGKAAMDDIYNTVVTNNNENINNAKDRATEELENEAEKAKDSINQLENLTDEDKQAAKDSIDDALEKGKEAIENADSPSDIQSEKDKTIDKIEAIVDDAKLNDEKLLANKELKEKAETLKDGIDHLKNVTKEDKEKAKAAIDEALKHTEVAVEKSDSLPALNEAIQAGEDDMNDIYQNVRVTILEAPTATDIYDNELLVEGTGIAGATVILKVDGVEIARTTVNSKLKANAYSLENNGTFSLVLPKTLQAGTSIELVQVYGGLTSEPTTIKVLQKHNEDLDLTDDHITKPEAEDTTITGKGEPGANIVITDKDGNVLGEGTVNKNGKFEVELNRPLVKGEEIFINQYKDGQEGETLSLTIGSNLEGDGPEEDNASQIIDVESDKKEDPLPSTATNMYNTLLVGIFLLALGLLSLFVVIRRKSNE